jgi:hypothetical protein
MMNRHSTLPETNKISAPVPRPSARIRRLFQTNLQKLLALLLALLPAGLVATGCRTTRSVTDPILSKPSKLEGQQAPGFTLQSDSGTNVSSADFAGHSKLVIVFYRGYW